ncbi:RNA polymerase sigma factor [Patescibacteria group bacterium]
MKDVQRLSDEELVELVRSKDQELYREIVLRYQDKLLRYATYLLHDEQRAADAVQQSLIKAYINLNGFDKKKKFSSWIYRIVHNESINCIKKKKREISLDANSWVKETIQSNEDIMTDLSVKDGQIALQKCIDTLPIRYKGPLSLYFFEEKSYEEISDILKIPIGTVGTRINRGKKILKQIIQPSSVNE